MAEPRQHTPGNALAGETSPYLLLHQHQPVHWQPWGSAALAQAKRENKPILLSIGYAACHWCHVMARESFSDPQVAELLNKFFINIKVDREERPDLDQVYQEALLLLGRQGGWPLTLFLTPDGKPCWGGTYFPPESRHGIPAFKEVLWQLISAWRGQAADLTQQSDKLYNSLQGLSHSRSGRDTLPLERLDELVEDLVRLVDTDHGGIGHAPKFPTVPAFELLWHSWRRSGNRLCAAATRLTLDQICRGGIYDHLGGGFARYTVDAAWQIPHFEKMLYDNALLIGLLTKVWRETQSPLYADRVRATVHWALNALRLTPEGAFASALDADSAGAEGQFYTWSEAEIDTLLGAESAAFKATYGVTAEGNFDTANVLYWAGENWDGEAEAALATARATLLAARAQRQRPARDDKLLAEWNGLMITALTEASLSFGEPTWLAAAAAAFADTVARLEAPDHGLYRSWCSGRPGRTAVLEDYAAMCRAALALYEATGTEHYMTLCQQWLHVLRRDYYDPAQGGYFQTSVHVKDLLVRPKTATDNATPSGNGMLLHVFGRLYALTGNPVWREEGIALFTAFSGGLDDFVYPYASLLLGYEMLTAAVHVVVVGAPDAPATQALQHAIYTTPCPTRVGQVLADTRQLGATHPAFGKTTQDGHPTAYVCLQGACLAPATTPADLQARLLEAEKRLSAGS